jgi:hypothetical protein
MRAMLREGENIYHSRMDNVPTFKKKYHQYQYQYFFLRPKNAKNHAISILQMQGCPQSNIKKKLNLFVSKISLKAIMNFLKTKKPKLKVFF